MLKIELKEKQKTVYKILSETIQRWQDNFDIAIKFIIMNLIDYKKTIYIIMYGASKTLIQHGLWH